MALPQVIHRFRLANESIGQRLPLPRVTRAIASSVAAVVWKRQYLPSDPFDQPPGAAQQGDPPTDRRWSGSSPIGRSLLRLVGMLLAEQDDEWAVGRNYFSAESMALIDAPRPTEEVPPGLLIAS